MDGDPAVEPALDGFSRVLPLPYRVALIAVLAIWGWGANLHYLHQRRIDVAALLCYEGGSSASASASASLPLSSSTPSSPSSGRGLPPDSTYRLAAAASALWAASLLLFWLLTRGDADRVLAVDWLPMTTLVALGLLLVLPVPGRVPVAVVGWRGAGAAARPWWKGGGGGGGGGSGRGRSPSPSSSPSLATLPRDGRRRFAAMLRRVAVGGLAEQSQGRFGDVLLADAVTSCSRVLADLYVCVCMFFVASGGRADASATDRPDRACGGAVVVPLLLAAPFAARLRQCLIEYRRARRSGGGGAAAAAAGQHLANAAKYATSFPVIALAALQRNAQAAAGPDGTPPPAAFTYYQLWMLAVAVNSLYSFYWDATRDWDLTLLAGARARSAPDNAGWGLRRHLLLAGGQPGAYYAVVALDLALRCAWTVRLRAPLGAAAGGEGALFVLELLEVLRRWVWIFFRVETEWIRTASAAAASGAGAVGGHHALGLLDVGGPGGSRSSSSGRTSSSAGMQPTDIALGDYARYEDN